VDLVGYADSLYASSIFELFAAFLAEYFIGLELAAVFIEVGLDPLADDLVRKLLRLRCADRIDVGLRVFVSAGVSG
jgi:hypothetical protein